MAQRDRQHIQVLVVGASIAGCATAWVLADTGLNVTLVERLRRESPLDHFGESLSPKCLLDLKRLDLREAEELFGRRTYGIQSAWGSDSVTARSFAATVPGHGLHIDKERLVRILRDRVEANGTKIHYGHRLRIKRTNSDGSHLVSMETNDSKIEAIAGVLVDATGRTRAVARQYTDIMHYDRLIATASRGQAVASPPGNLSPGVSFTEAVSDGWWYSASLHNGQRIAIRFSDNHEEITQRLRNNTQFWDELRQTQWTSKFFENSDEKSKIDIRSAASTALRQFSGPGWVAVGDAARTVDPLSSQGIHNGILDGIRVADAIGACGADPAGMVALRDYLQESQEAYFRQRSAMYGLENRWPHESFWKLRKD